MLLKEYYKTIIVYDLINKFNYKNIKSVPKLKKINLGLKLKIQHLTAENSIITTVALGFICDQAGVFATTKKAKAFLRIRKGSPIGSKIVLKKITMFKFFSKLTDNIFPKIRYFFGLYLTKKKLINSFSFKLKTKLLLCENNFLIYNEFFKYLPFYTNISFVTTSKNKQELKFLLCSYKLRLIQL
jgi:large subunit ribosomal protein L5